MVKTKSTGTDTVYFRLDPSNPPTMTEEQMKALRDLRDEDIDYQRHPSPAGAQAGGAFRN